MSGITQTAKDFYIDFLTKAINAKIDALKLSDLTVLDRAIAASKAEMLEANGITEEYEAWFAEEERIAHIRKLIQTNDDANDKVRDSLARALSFKGIYYNFDHQVDEIAKERAADFLDGVVGDEIKKLLKAKSSIEVQIMMATSEPKLVEFVKAYAAKLGLIIEG